MLYYVYILTNTRKTVLYIGVTNNLERRYIEHALKKNNANFVSKYNVSDLIYYEEYVSIYDAIAREKQLKGWTLKKKLSLIKNINPDLVNLYKNFL